MAAGISTQRIEAVTIRPRGDHAVAERPRPCPSCNDGGYQFEKDENGYDRAVPCVCKAVDARVTRFNNAHLPARFHSAMIGTFQAPPNSALARARAASGRFCREYAPGQPGLLFHGPCGTGKTHLMVGILREMAIGRGREVRFVEFTHLLSDLRASFGRPGASEMVMAPLVSVELLGIDELGKGRGSEWELSVIDDLISKRYNANRTTIFTSNYEPDLGREVEGGLVDRVGVRVVSRLAEMCRFIGMPGADYRQRAQG
jgi:DNA replication protein DnaC